jgi:hypothetical protein
VLGRPNSHGGAERVECRTDILNDDCLMHILLGNCKLNTFVDTVTRPVLLCCMATKIKKAGVSIGTAGCYIEKARDK